MVLRCETPRSEQGTLTSATPTTFDVPPDGDLK
jgi:hypothetical protein